MAIASPSSHVEVRRWQDGSLVTDALNGMNGVTALAFSPDGTLLAGSDANGVTIWRLADGAVQNRIPSFSKASLLSLSRSGDDVAAALGSWVSVWHASGPAVAGSFNSDPVGGLAISPDGAEVVATTLTYLGNANHGVHVIAWSATTKAVLWDQNYGLNSIGAGRVAYSPDGTMVAAGTNTQTGVVVLKPATGAQVVAIATNGDPWAFSSDGTAIAGTAAPGTSAAVAPAVFRLSDGTVARSFPLTDAGKLLSVGFGPSLAVRTVDKTSSTFGFAENGTASLALPAILDGNGTYAAFSRDGLRVATATSGGKVTLWNAADRSLLAQFSGRGPVAFEPNGGFLLHTDGNQTLLADEVVGPITWSSINTGTHVNALAFSPSGTTFVTGNDDNTGTVRKTSDGSVLFSLWNVANGHTAKVNAVAFSGDGQKIATASWDDTIKLWNAADGTFIQTLKQNPASGYGAIVFTTDATGLNSIPGLGASGGILQLWSFASGSVVSTFPSSGGVALALSADSTLFAPGLAALKVPGWTPVPSLPVLPFVYGLSLSGDGTRLASIDGDGVGRIYCLQ